MRRLLSLFVLLTLTWVAAGAQKLEPVFSTEAAPQYVRIQFKTGEAFLQDNGEGQPMRTALFAKNGQTFALIGNKDAFVLRSDKGNYVTMAADIRTSVRRPTNLKPFNSPSSPARDTPDATKSPKATKKPRESTSGAAPARAKNLDSGTQATRTTRSISSILPSNRR